MTNDNEKENIGAISNEENQQNVDFFTMANVQNYILAQRAESTVKKKKKERKEEEKKSWLISVLFYFLENPHIP